ncbi:MAG: hypothetical protein HFE63_08035 [Clostridiales bacterium]|nr:hypothetical protein [Clostridiales bacterium]
MKAGYNLKLKEAAADSVLHRSAIIVFICDSELRICMKSTLAEKVIKRPITGSSIRQYLDDSFTKKILDLQEGWLRGDLFINETAMSVIVYTGELDGEKYYAFVSESGMKIESFDILSKSIKESISELIVKTGEIIDDLLHCKTGISDKLINSNTRMIRLKRCIALMLEEEQNDNRRACDVSVTILLNQLCRMCSEVVSAYGYRIVPEYSNTLRYCECSSRMLMILVLTMMYNAMSASSDGMIVVNLKHSIYERQLDIMISTDTKFECTENSTGNLIKLSELLVKQNVLPFVLELKVCTEIISAHGWKSGYDINDGRLTLTLSLPETTVVRSVMSAHAESSDILFAERIINDLFIDLVKIYCDNSNKTI